MSRLRILALFAALLALATALAACGGGDSSDEPPKQVLDQTFSTQNTIKSADVDATLAIDASGPQGGNVKVKVSGPVQSQGEGEVAQFDLTLTASGKMDGRDVDFDGGLVSTGDAGYVKYKGDYYKLDPQTFDQIKELASVSTPQQLQNFGVPKPQSFLVDLKNEGEEDVEGAETTHISGKVDVPKVVQTFAPLLSSASALGIGDGNLPSESQLRKAGRAIKSATFDIYSGTDDHLLRKVDATLDIAPPDRGGEAKVDLDVTLADVNEAQDINAPANAKPLSELLQKLGVNPLGGALGGLGNLLPKSGKGGKGSSGGLSIPIPGVSGSGGGSGGGGSGGGGTTIPIPPGATSGQAAYLKCVQSAKTPLDLQKCTQKLSK